MADLLEQLTTQYDIVLIDTPPLLPVTDAAILAKITGGALVVTARSMSVVDGRLRQVMNTGTPRYFPRKPAPRTLRLWRDPLSESDIEMAHPSRVSHWTRAWTSPGSTSTICAVSRSTLLLSRPLEFE